MSLRSLNLPPLLNTSDHDLIADFFAPALGHAWRYDRGVGYFSWGWLRLAAAGRARHGNVGLQTVGDCAKKPVGFRQDGIGWNRGWS
jgi:hypothetical protein